MKHARFVGAAFLLLRLPPGDSFSSLVMNVPGFGFCQALPRAAAGVQNEPIKGSASLDHLGVQEASSADASYHLGSNDNSPSCSSHSKPPNERAIINLT